MYLERADALRRNCRGGHIAASQIEVWAVSKQTLSWLDSGGRSTTIPGRGDKAGGATGILRGGIGSTVIGRQHLRSNVLLRMQQCLDIRNVSLGVFETCWLHVGSTISWCQSSHTRLWVERCKARNGVEPLPEGRIPLVSALGTRFSPSVGDVSCTRFLACLGRHSTPCSAPVFSLVVSSRIKRVRESERE